MASPDYLSILDDILGKYDYNGVKLPPSPDLGPDSQGMPPKAKGSTNSILPSVSTNFSLSDIPKALSGVMGAPGELVGEASTKLTGKPASAWAKKGMDTLSPGIQMLNGAIANLKQVNPHWGEVADAMKDEAETHAAKLGTDPVIYMLPASRILSALFGMQSASGAGEAAGQGLAEYDKSGSITPEVGRAAVRSIVQLGMGGLAASHGAGEIGKGVGPDVTFGEGKSSLGDFAKQALPSFEKKPVSALGSSPDIDKYLDSLNSEDITKPIGYKSGELTDPKYQVPNKPDSQWKRVKAGSNGATPDWMGQAADNLSGKNRPKATLTSDMLGLQQTWEKGRSLIDSLKAKGKVIPGPKRIAREGDLARAEDGEGNPLRYDNALGLEIPTPIKSEKVPIVKSDPSPDRTANITQGQRNELMARPLAGKWKDHSGWQVNNKEFDPDPEIAKHLETFKAVDHFFENVDSSNEHLYQANATFNTKDSISNKFAALVKDTPASVWRTRANLDNEWYYNRLNKLADEWKDWPDRPGSILLKQAVKSITGSKAEIYNPRQHKITPAALKVYTPIVERMYRESQEALHSTDFEHIASKEGGFSTTRTIPDFGEGSDVFDYNNDEGYHGDEPIKTDDYRARDLMDEHIAKQDDPYMLRDQLSIQHTKKVKAVVSKDQPTLHLYRGVAHDAKDKFGILESWTTYKPVAEGFGGNEALLEADIPKSQILTFHRSPNWRQHEGGIGENEFEYIVIGKPVDAAKLARQVGKVKAATAPGVAKEVFGKPPDPIQVEKNKLNRMLDTIREGHPDMEIGTDTAGQISLKEPDGKQTYFADAGGLSTYLYSKHSLKPAKAAGAKKEIFSTEDKEYMQAKLESMYPDHDFQVHGDKSVNAYWKLPNEKYKPGWDSAFSNTEALHKYFKSMGIEPKEAQFITPKTAGKAMPYMKGSNITPITFSELQAKYPNEYFYTDPYTGNILHHVTEKSTGSLSYSADDLGTIKQADKYLSSLGSSDHEAKYGESAKGLGKAPNPVQAESTVEELNADNPNAKFKSYKNSVGETLYQVYSKDGKHHLGAYVLSNLLDSNYVSKKLSDKYKDAMKH